jgi:hypothetical protein
MSRRMQVSTDIRTAINKGKYFIYHVPGKSENAIEYAPPILLFPNISYKGE